MQPTETLNPEVSVTAEYLHMAPREFADKIATKWNASERILRSITEEVENENVKPVEGIRAFSCVLAGLFGYDEFHGKEINPTDLYAALVGGVRSPESKGR